MKRVAFRTDASLRIGSGHVSRCLALADALGRRGAECEFITRAHPGNLDDLIRSRGHSVFSFGEPDRETRNAGETNYAGWLGAAAERDARATCERVAIWSPDWLVVDHYALDGEWEAAVGGAGCRILAIDDLANRSHAADALLDQNVFDSPAGRYRGRVNEGAAVYLGPRYALVPAPFRRARRNRGWPERDKVSRVFVYFGGVDAPNLTGAALAALSRPAFANLEIDLVAGSRHPRRQELERLAGSRPLTRFHGFLPHLAEVMGAADLAIGAGGTTTWERCALGLPVVVLATAANQCGPGRGLAAAGASRFLGHHGEIPDATGAIAGAVEALGRDDEQRNAMALRAWRLCDGFGAERLAELLDPSAAETLSVRTAGWEDIELYYDWASDPQTRANSFSPGPIAWSDHVRWFEAKRDDPDSRMRVVETPHGLPVGQVRLDRRADGVFLSYSIDADFRGRGWGKRALELARSVWRESWENLDLVAEVKYENAVSRELLRRAGFVEALRENDRIRFILRGRI